MIEPVDSLKEVLLGCLGSVSQILEAHFIQCMIHADTERCFFKISDFWYSPLLSSSQWSLLFVSVINPLNAELNPICHLLALLGAHHILHVSRIRVKLS